MSDQTRQEFLQDLARQMGDAGYCNYEACKEFLQRAFTAGRSAGSDLLEPLKAAAILKQKEGK